MANCIRCGRQLPPFTWKKICQWCVQHERAQRGEDVEVQTVMPTPWTARRSESPITLTRVIFGACVAVFVAMVLASEGIDFTGKVMVHFGANFGPYTLSGQWWRLVTYIFLHGSIMHIAFNMWCLWDLGQLCESLYGRWTFGAIYLITGVAGGLGSIAWNPSVLSVGASGAIFGLAGALLASFYLGEFSLPRVAISGTLRSLAFFIGFNILFGAGLNFFGGGSGGIDNACHIGGLVSGLALGALIARVAPQHDAPVRRFSVIAVVALAVLAAGFGVRQWRGAPFRMDRSLDALSASRDPIGQLQSIVKKNPNMAPAHFALAEAYFQHQQFPQAEAEFKRVVELDPNNAKARFDLAMSYLSDKRFDDARATLEQLQALHSDDGYAHYGMGLLLSDQQNYPAALEEFKKAESSSSEISGLYFEMGNAYANLKRYDEAISSYSKEKDRNGDGPDVENALADAYQAKGMTHEAQDARNKAAQLKSGHP